MLNEVADECEDRLNSFKESREQRQLLANASDIITQVVEKLVESPAQQTMKPYGVTDSGGGRITS
jgi:hypothetical protein